MRNFTTPLILATLLGFILSACSYDDLVVDDREQQDVLKRQHNYVELQVLKTE